jgi:hypothetical protein
MKCPSAPGSREFYWQTPIIVAGGDCVCADVTQFHGGVLILLGVIALHASLALAAYTQQKEKLEISKVLEYKTDTLEIERPLQLPCVCLCTRKKCAQIARRLLVFCSNAKVVIYF